ncbi:MAG: hypothetical protein KBC12_02955 [Candidatus Pacebacteria bacterium]|jgi:hypothetical protein|nr:hypothetical protein [Candidatus Paceibacterota bacterium]MBP9851574.1 hypothetical protein [Candidatus Paceibacterota bacterium]
MKIREPFVVFTNLVFIIPLYFGLAQQAYLYAGVIFIVFVFSSIFHITKPPGTVWPSEVYKLNKRQKFFLRVDEVLAYCLVLFNLYVFWTKGFPLYFWYAVATAFVGLIFLYFPKQQNKYEFFHGTWHLLSGLFTLFAVLSLAV